jgi:hypothetical protein
MTFRRAVLELEPVRESVCLGLPSVFRLGPNEAVNVLRVRSQRSALGRRHALTGGQAASSRSDSPNLVQPSGSTRPAFWVANAHRYSRISRVGWLVHAG